MPITLEFDPSFGGVHARYEGDITEDELRRAFDELVSLPFLEPGMPHLVDLTGGRFAVDGPSVRRLAERNARLPGALGEEYFVAVVAVRPVTRAWARMHAMFVRENAPEQVRFVSSVDEGRAWLRARRG